MINPTVRNVFHFLNDIMPSTSKISISRVVQRYFEEEVSQESDLMDDENTIDEENIDSRALYNSFYYGSEYIEFYNQLCKHIKKKIKKQ